MAIYQLDLTVRSPLHIGSGGPLLRQGIDFMTVGRFVYVLDLNAVLDFILPPDAPPERVDEIMRVQNLASFLTQADLQRHPALVLYRLGGGAAVREVRPQLKTVFAQPYLPGSTLKGALRTALGTALAEQQGLALTMAQLGQRREWAGREVEQSLFGRAPRPAQAPNYDLLRTIQVADSAPMAAETLGLENVVVWPAGDEGIPIDVEAIRPGSRTTTRLKLDDYLLSPAARDLGFGASAELMRGWADVCQRHGIAQIAQEAAFFAERAPAVERFYAGLLREAEQRVPGSFFVQLGWGAGWHAKTLSRIIKPNRALLAQIIERYRLTRGFHQPGAAFPRTRHVVADQRRQPLEPLGWVQVQLRPA